MTQALVECMSASGQSLCFYYFEMIYVTQLHYFSHIPGFLPSTNQNMNSNKEGMQETSSALPQSMMSKSSFPTVQRIMQLPILAERQQLPTLAGRQQFMPACASSPLRTPPGTVQLSSQTTATTAVRCATFQPCVQACTPVASQTLVTTPPSSMVRFVAK